MPADSRSPAAIRLRSGPDAVQLAVYRSPRTRGTKPSRRSCASCPASPGNRCVNSSKHGHAKVNGELCLDPARRLKEGETVELLARPAPKPRQAEAIVIRHLDEHVVVVEKPSGLPTVRHPSERDWTERRKALAPTLEDLVPPIIAREEGRKAKGPRLRVVHRLDKETSGLVVFARTVTAERGLGKQFHAHTVVRRYLAVVPGFVPPQTHRLPPGPRPRRRPARRHRQPRRRQGGRDACGRGGTAARIHAAVVPVGDGADASDPHSPGRAGASASAATRCTATCRTAACGRTPAAPRGWPCTPSNSASATRRRAKPLHWSMPLPPDLEAFLARLRGRPGRDDHAD